MTYIVDTNVLSEMRKRQKAHPGVRRWAASVDARDLYLSTITVYESELGILRLGRKDQRQASVLRAWFHTRILPAFADRILPVDSAVALRCAGLHVPDPCSLRDSLIAATALEHGMTIVTRNVRDFERTAVQLVNPWES
ncbi:MAG TPA: type II toxin-antitoxin system VapC family toxin [Terracidiphilus sp.]|nr:type II toxin-antitoxin system VapC family toxin [Terracidiphilus sp.]